MIQREKDWEMRPCMANMPREELGLEIGAGT